jgi:hypothetical protein
MGKAFGRTSMKGVAGKRVSNPKMIIKKHCDGYVAYASGLKGVVVGEGDSCEEAMADVKSAIRFHVKTFW